jgi:subtilase family serine protease
MMSRRRRLLFRPLVDALDDRCLLAGPGLSPAQVAAAYGLGGLTFGGKPATGAGQTIAIVDAYADPNLAAEVAMFDSANNLPAPPSLTIVGQSGTQALPRPSAGWAQEQALDVEWAHALAPGAAIVLVETNSTSIPDLMAGVKTAAAMPGVSVVSMSWGGSEIANVTAYDRVFTAAAITFTAASGDNGPSGGAQWPASSPYVVSVGGTALGLTASGSYQSETAWTGSSGGTSTIETEPTYQQAVESSGWRSTPDVAFDADTGTGVGVYTISPFGGQGTWVAVGGTSLGAPAWAAIVALADQGRAQNNASSLGSFQTLTALYGLPSSAFHVIGGGYNNQTGLGTPNGSALVNGLVAFNMSGATSPPPVTSTPTPTPTAPPISNWPVISLPVLTAPVTTAPVTSSPVTSAPVVTPPVASPPPSSAAPVTSQQQLTPPPAAAPVNVNSLPKKKRGHKHATGHVKRLAHPHPAAHVSPAAKR